MLLFRMLAILLFSGFCVLISLNGATIILGFMSLPLIFIYPFMKRVTYWPQAFLGLTFNFGALMGWTSVTGEISLVPVLLYIACIFWTLGYDTIYAHQDKEDDALIGIKSTALKFGNQSKKWVAGFYIGFLIFMGLAIIVSGSSLYSALAVPLMGIHLFWQLKTWDMDNPNSSLKIFKSNKSFGLITLFFLFATSFA